MNVVVVTPNPGDSSLAAKFIEEAAIATRRCATLAEAVPLIGADTGCVVVVEEALDGFGVDSLRATLHRQPAWSDVPFVLVAAQGSSLWSLVETLFPDSGNVTLLQRPIHPASLVSAVSVAMRSRLRQFQVRDLLSQRESSVRHRDEFLAMLAHELRNPLNPMRAAAYMMGRLEIDDEVFLSCRSIVEKQVQHISRLVDDLLDVSRLEVGKVELRRQVIDLNECVAGAVEAVKASRQSRDHVISLRLPPQPLTVSADPVRIEQAISNLIVNAIKFTPPGGHVDIEVVREGETAVVSVTDDGAGIQPQMLDSIFDLFTQDSVTLARSKGGLGIGLTLVRRLMELHGGTVRAFSEGPGKGSRFDVRLPLVTAANDVPGQPSPAPRDTPPKRVLVIEDGADSRTSLGMLLSIWKHEVFFASNGTDGLARALEAQPDVAIIDIGLPGLDGYQVAKHIRGDDSDWSRQVRLIALTGYGQASDRARAMDAGFDVHILKPVDPLELRLLLA